MQDPPNIDDAMRLAQSLPASRQRLAIEFIHQLAAFASPAHRMPDGVQAIIDESRARAERGEFASEEDVDAALNRPWG